MSLVSCIVGLPTSDPWISSGKQLLPEQMGESAPTTGYSLTVGMPAKVAYGGGGATVTDR